MKEQAQKRRLQRAQGGQRRSGRKRGAAPGVRVGLQVVGSPADFPKICQSESLGLAHARGGDHDVSQSIAALLGRIAVPRRARAL